MRLAIISAFVSLFIITLFFASHHLTESPPLWYDEGIYTQDALNVATYGASLIQTAPGHFESAWSSSGGFPFVYPIALSYKLFGVSVESGRAVMVVFMLLFVAAATFLVYTLFGTRSALWTLALLATFPVLYGNGKTVIGEIPGLLYLATFLIVVAHIEKKQFKVSVPFFFLAGLIAGLCVVTKPLFLVLPVAVIAALIWQRNQIPWRMNIVIAAVLGGVVPLAVHLLMHLNGASLATIIGYYANPYGIAGGSLVSTILGNVLRFMRESSPAYCALVYAVWCASVVWRVYRKRPVSLVEKIALIFALFVFVAYVRTAGWYRYFFTANVLALMFFPAALSSFGLRRCAIVIMVALILMQSYQLLFTSFVAQYDTSHRTAQIREQFAGVSATSTLFFLDVPELALFAEKRPYYQYLKETAPFVYGEDQLPRIAKGIPDVVIVRSSDAALYTDLLVHYATTSDTGYAFFYKTQ